MNSIINHVFDFAKYNILSLAICIFIPLFIRFKIKSLLLFKKINKTPLVDRLEVDYDRLLSQYTSLPGTISIFLLSCSLSTIIFLISTTFVEYPMFGIIYKKENNQWVKAKGRVFHSFLKGDEETYTLYSEKYDHIQGQYVFEEQGIILEYYINEESIPIVLSKLEIRNKNLKKDVEYFMYKKSKKFFITHELKELLDDSHRLELFKQYFAPYGITIISTEFP